MNRSLATVVLLFAMGCGDAARLAELQKQIDERSTQLAAAEARFRESEKTAAALKVAQQQLTDELAKAKAQISDTQRVLRLQSDELDALKSSYELDQELAIGRFLIAKRSFDFAAAVGRKSEDVRVRGAMRLLKEGTITAKVHGFLAAELQSVGGDLPYGSELLIEPEDLRSLDSSRGVEHNEHVRQLTTYRNGSDNERAAIVYRWESERLGDQYDRDLVIAKPK